MGRKIPDQLLTGFVLIDRQHEQIYEKFDALLSLVRQGAGKREILAALRFVEQHAFTNFDFEETAMKAYDYPDRVAHMAAHLVLREAVTSLKAEVEESGARPEMVARVKETLYDALFRHIAEFDLKMAPFLKEKNPDDWTL